MGFAEPHHDHGTVTGIAVGDPSLGYVTLNNKIWGICSALGNIAFAYSFSMILIEIQVPAFEKIDIMIFLKFRFYPIDLKCLKS